MKDKYIFENILSLTKSLITISVNGTIESSNPKIKSFFNDSLDEFLKMQKNIFDKMEQEKFYNIANVKKTDIVKIATKICDDNN